MRALAPEPHRPRAAPWHPDLSRLGGPRYRAIADALANDVAAGRLLPGMRLPTHRNLAYGLGVTVGTVTRAYAEAERRGLIGGEVGRGTYVLGPPRDAALMVMGRARGNLIDLSVNTPTSGHEAAEMAVTLAELSADASTLARIMGYQPVLGRPEHRAALAEMQGQMGTPVDPERLAITAGAQNGVVVALAAVTRPGDTIVSEMLTYGGIRSAARLLHLKLRGVAMDEEGMRPDALAQLCRETEVRAIYCIPTLHNPTGITWSAERRAAILEVAGTHGVPIIEDDVYGFLVDPAPPSLTSMAPDRVIMISGASKVVAGGLRVGVVVAPEGLMERVEAAIRATVVMAPPLTAELVSRWVADGRMVRTIAAKRAAGIARQALARKIFDRPALTAIGARFAPTDPAAFHLWLPLPEPWTGDGFAADALGRGVRVSPGWNFAVGRSGIEAVRISLGNALSTADLSVALGSLADLLEGPGPSGISPL